MSESDAELELMLRHAGIKSNHHIARLIATGRLTGAMIRDKVSYAKVRGRPTGDNAGLILHMLYRRLGMGGTKQAPLEDLRRDLDLP